MNGNEIVKYHNDLNKIRLPSFTELEQNLLFSLILKIKEQKEKSFYFGNSEIRDMIEEKYRYNNNEIVRLCKSLKEKFFKADFTIITKETLNVNNTFKEVLAEKTINLFTEFSIYYDKDVGDFHPEPMIINFIGIALEINPKFAYLINELTKNFTAFELAEFIALSGKYTKTLYRLLKQFRSTGIARFEWSEFLRILDIPESYQMCDIDRRILKPAIKDLTKERNLFDQKRMPFINLAYEKIKATTAKGKNGKVIGITFTFKPENIELEKEKKELAHESEKITTIDNKILSICNKMVEGAYKFSYQDKTYKALSFDYENLTFSCVELIRNEIGFFDEKSVRTFQQKNKETFLTMLETFVSKIC